MAASTEENNMQNNKTKMTSQFGSERGEFYTASTVMPAIQIQLEPRSAVGQECSIGFDQPVTGQDQSLLSLPRRSKRIFHYTTMYGLSGIKKDGFIRPADLYVAKEERPIVWFSADQKWEPTVMKGIRTPDGRIEQLDLWGLLEHQILPIRIGVEPHMAPYRWAELQKLSGMSPIIAQGLELVAKREGASHKRWRGTFDPVTADQWKSVEYFNGKEWVSVPGESDVVASVEGGVAA